MGRDEIMTRSKTLSTRFKTFIDALPDLLLLEILCRIPLLSAVQCKVVCKRWLKALSEIYFVERFLAFQRKLQTPISDALLVIREFRYGFLQKLSATKTLLLPSGFKYKELDSRSPKGFRLACSKYEETNDPSQISGGLVMQTYNDLVLYCKKSVYHNEYFICNPYTKQWVAFPPATQAFPILQLGFICEPYYTEQQNSNAGYIVNPGFKCRVVRVLPNFHLEIFSSETGEWMESGNALVLREGSRSSKMIAYKGMLCWLETEPGHSPSRQFTCVLDVFNCPTTPGFDFTDKCQIIEGPNMYDDHLPRICDDPFLGVSGGRLYATKPLYHIHSEHNSHIWELKEEVEDGGRLKLKWHLIVDGVPLPDMIRNAANSFFQNLPEWEILTVLIFHPTDEDLMYAYINRRTAICNMRERTIEIIADFPVSLEALPLNAGRNVFPIMLPWWPTAIPPAFEKEVVHYYYVRKGEIIPYPKKKRRTVNLN